MLGTASFRQKPMTYIVRSESDSICPETSSGDETNENTDFWCEGEHIRPDRCSRGILKKPKTHWCCPPNPIALMIDVSTEANIEVQNRPFAKAQSDYNRQSHAGQRKQTDCREELCNTPATPSPAPPGTPRVAIHCHAGDEIWGSEDQPAVQQVATEVHVTPPVKRGAYPYCRSDDRLCPASPWRN